MKRVSWRRNLAKAEVIKLLWGRGAGFAPKDATTMKKSGQLDIKLYHSKGGAWEGCVYPEFDYADPWDAWNPGTPA